jgi:hypothetical protein
MKSTKTPDLPDNRNAIRSLSNGKGGVTKKQKSKQLDYYT